MNQPASSEELERVLAEEMEPSRLSAKQWAAVCEWLGRQKVEFFLKPVLEDNPSLVLSIQQVESDRLVTREDTVAFRAIEWIKVPQVTPFRGKSQPDPRPFLRAQGIPFEERTDGLVLRGPRRKLKSPA